MAAVLRLENEAATTTFDLLSDLQVIAGRQTYDAAAGRVIETFFLSKFAATRAAIHTEARNLEDMLVDMVNWHEDVLKNDSVWIRRATDTETVKRALVYGYEFKPVDGPVLGSLMHYQPAAVYELAITRHAAYEPVSSVNANQLTNQDFIGGSWDISGAISGGAIPSRIAAMRFRTQQGLGRFWAGIREVRGGTANFESLIELEQGSQGADTTIGSDATASPGSGQTEMITTFASPSMQYRVSMTFNNLYVTDAEAEDQVGRYNVIIRLRQSTASNEFGVKMVYGFAASVFDTDAPQVHYEIQHIAHGSSTQWGMHSLGIIDIPSGGLRQLPITKLTVGEIVRNMKLRIHAERTAGSGNLHMDCLILIPADHTIFVDGITTTLVANDDVWVFTHEDDSLSAYVEKPADGSIIDFPPVADIGIEPWGYPEGGGLLVVAGERGKADSVFGDVFDEFHIDDLFKRFLIYHA